jgi:Rieske 2Fe-2S family protein
MEKEKIFMKDWLCVARVEEIEKPGDYMTFRIAGEPLIVVRNRAGELKALANVCAHRGVEVASGQGNVMRFSCPYHGWQYDLDGKLTGAAFMAESEVFQRDCSLPQVKLGVWAGWIFVNFDPAAEPLQDFISEVDREFGFVRQEDCRLAAKFDYELDCNWKLLVENFLDIYHVKVLHSKTFGKHARRAEDYPFNIQRRGGFSAFHASAPMNPDGRTLFRKRDILAEQPDDFAASCHLAPNFSMFVRSDNVFHLTTWPIAPNRSRFIAYFLFPKEFADDPQYAAKVQVYADFFKKSLLEDQDMVRSLQGAMGSRNFRPGPFSKLESAVYNSISHYLERMF